jgi:uncharacterized membrane protein YtjA (UPF0391 family)
MLCAPECYTKLPGRRNTLTPPQKTLHPFTYHKKFNIMLRWSVTFFVIALIAAVLGFGGLAGSAAYLAKILFFIALIVFVISLISGRKRLDL